MFMFMTRDNLAHLQLSRDTDAFAFVNKTTTSLVNYFTGHCQTVLVCIAHVHACYELLWNVLVSVLIIIYWKRFNNLFKVPTPFDQHISMNFSCSKFCNHIYSQINVYLISRLLTLVWCSGLCKRFFIFTKYYSDFLKT